MDVINFTIKVSESQYKFVIFELSEYKMRNVHYVIF